MTDPNIINQFYKEELESHIIPYLSEKMNVDNREAMTLYYNSQLSQQIEQGLYGIENLDYKNLAEDLIETELQ